MAALPHTKTRRGVAGDYTELRALRAFAWDFSTGGEWASRVAREIQFPGAENSCWGVTWGRISVGCQN